MNDDLRYIADSNEEMLTYFNKIYTDHLSNLQDYKSKLFEINVKLDELTRTRSVYSLNTDYRKNIFSPIAMESSESEKEREIADEINELTDARDDMEIKIDEEDILLKSIENRLSKLNKAHAAIIELKNQEALREEAEKEEARRREEEEARKLEEEEDVFEFIEFDEDEDEEELSPELGELKKHYQNILMITAFDNTYVSTVLDKKIKDEIGINNHKLSNVSKLILVEPERAKLILEDIISDNKKILNVIEEQLKKLYYDFDDKQTINQLISSYIDICQDNHPSIRIVYNESHEDAETNFVKLLSLQKLLDIFFNNIFQHAKARSIEINSKLSDNLLKISITDNGIGITDDYMEKSMWYSGIHRAEELVFLNDGSLDIRRDVIGGTIVEFSIFI